MIIIARDRKLLGEMKIIEPISSLLDIDIARPVHFGCIGVLKNLCGNNNGISYSFLIWLYIIGAHFNINRT